MPALTVDDITVLPRIPEPDPTVARQRQVRSLTLAPRGFEGEGFPVRRAFAGVALEELDPFIHLDQMGEVEYAPGEPKGTPWHPHRGFETVTYMIDGTFEHSDSNGGGGLITNGDTQWMTAGAGILHIEKPPEELVRSGGLFHGFQLWVNLPRDQKWAAPRYQDIRAKEVALVSSPDGGALVRVIAGDVAGRRRPRLDLQPDDPRPRDAEPRSPALPCRGGPTTTPSCTSWRATGPVGPDGRPIATGQLAVLGAGDALTVSAGICPGESEPDDGRPDPWRTADPRARGLDGPVRDEHPRGGHAGHGRLPGWTTRQHPGRPQRPHDGHRGTPPRLSIVSLVAADPGQRTTGARARGLPR